MSENSFRTLRRSFRGGHCTLLPNYLNVVQVSGSNLEILGKILLKVSPGKKVCDFRTVFYVTPNFALPVDAILDLTTMKDLQMIIKAETNAVIYQGRHLAGMDNPSPLMSQDLSGTEPQQPVEETRTVSPIYVKEQLAVENKNVWPTVAAKVKETRGPRSVNEVH